SNAPARVVVCMDMWAPYANLVREYATHAQILFDRFHIVKHLNEAVEEVRRSEMRRLSLKERVVFKRSRWLLLKNPWNLNPDQKEPIHVGPLERANRARLLPERVLSTVLGLQTMQAGGNSFAEVDDIGHAIPARSFQEIRAYAAVPSGRSSAT